MNQLSTKQSYIKRFALFAGSACFGFFHSVICIPDSCAQSTSAQTASGPIDIQANEQEFAENVVLAKGEVTVTYKDSVIKAPEAKLYRDPAGQPEKAIFTGHPNLTQGDNKINADTLVFEIAKSKFIAQGNAHSEVISSGQEEIDPKAAPGKKTEVVKAETKKIENKKAASNESKNPKQPFAWPQASDDQSVFTANNVTAEKNTAKIESAGASTNKSKIANKPGQAEVEKIVTDSDYQEYEKDSGKFDATGHVHVTHGNISVYSDKLKLVYGLDDKPETAVFSGHVNAIQEGNSTQAETMTYYLPTKRLQATGNVRSKMIQQKPPEGNHSPNNLTKKTIGMQPGAGAATAYPASQATANEDEYITIVSDAQDFNKTTGKMDADGHVRVYYEDTVGVGPKVTLLRNAEGHAERVIFNGRSQISQPGKRWIADRITMAVATKKILAEGNTKAMIIQGSPPSHRSNYSDSALAMRSDNKGTASDNKLAVSKERSGTAISSSKVEVFR